MIDITIDGEAVSVPPGTTILEAARDRIPTLCFDDRQSPFGACRVCLVGVEGARGPVPACTTQVRPDMVIDTQDPTATRVARAVVELVLSELPGPPPEHTELAHVAAQLRVDEVRWPGRRHEVAHDERHPYLAFQHEWCISCGRCVRACDEVQGTFALTATGRGFEANITAGLDEGFRASACVACGACADTCPTDAIMELSLLRLE